MKTNMHFFIIYRSVLLRMRNGEKICKENENPHFMFSNFYFSENSAVYEIIMKNIVQPGRPQMTMWRMRIACRILKATSTHSENLMLLDFPLQQSLTESTLMLRYTYIVSIVLLRPPLWSSGQSFWLQIERSRVRFPSLPDFLSSSESGTGSTQPREVN